MKKVLKALILCSFVMSCITVSADSTDISIRADMNGMLHIGYTADSGKMVVTVVKSEDYNSQQSASLGEKINNMIHMDQIDAATGETVFLPNAENKAAYTAVIRNSEQSQSYTREFVWYDLGETQAFFQSLEEDAAAAIDEYTELINLYCGDYSGLSAGSKSEIKSFFSENAAADFKSFVTACGRAIAILHISDVDKTALTTKNNRIDDLLVQNAELLGLDTLSEWDKYKSGSDEFKLSFAKRIAKQKKCGIDDFYAEFKEQLYLTQIAMTVNYSQIKPILTEFNESCGLDISQYFALGNTKSIDTRLVGYDASDKTAIEKMIKNNISSDNTGGGSGGSGSGGGSSGGSGGGVVFAGSGNSAAQNTDKKYSDIPDGYWAAEAIEVLSGRGVISGYEDGTFRPLQDITRAEFLTLLLKAFSFTDSEAVADFADVADGDWFYSYAATAQHYGIVSGYEDNTFRAGNTITRQEAACMMANLANVRAIALAGKREYTGFADGADIADYAKDSVIKLYCADIINGREGNTFAPGANLTRAEAAQLIFALVKASA